MPNSILQHIHKILAAICAGLLFSATVQAEPPGGNLACSDDADSANINEINFPGGAVADFIEVIILENGTAIDGWELCTQTSTNLKNPSIDCVTLGAGNLNEYFYGNPQGDDASPDSFNTGTYLKWQLPNNVNLNATFGEVILVDATDAIVDYIRFCNDASCAPGYWSAPAACGFVLPEHDANNKDVARIPDGSGDFTDNGTTTTIGDTNDGSGAQPVFGFTMDEALWDGTSGEVIDSQDVAAGTAVNGATTASTNPAITGSPGTCGYGNFDGSNDYVSVNVSSPGSEIEIANTLTLSGWVYTTDNTTEQTIFSFADGDDYLRLSVTATGKLTYSSSMTSPSPLSTADNTIQNNTWYFVALVVDPANGNINLYTATQAGSVSLVDSWSYTVSGEFEIEIENGGEVTLGGGPGLASLNGYLDEVSLFGGALGTASLNDLKNTTRACPLSGPDHYEISHAGTGITCAPTDITFTAHDAAHTAVEPTAGTTITVTAPVPGTWLGIASGGGSGSFTSLGGGQATYAFAAGETTVTLQLDYAQIGTINLDVTDGTISESEDPDLVIERAALLFSSIGTQISGKDSNTGFGAQTITLQAVRATDSDPTVCVPGFPDGSVRSIEIAAECNNPGTCAGNQVSITNNATTTPVATNNDNATTATTGYTPVNLLFGTNATAELVLNYPDAGQLSLHAKYELASDDPNDFMDGTSGSSNLFVVRPFGFSITDIRNYGADTIYGNGDDVIYDPLQLGLADGSGNAFIAAEDVFRVTVTGRLYDAAEADANGNPLLTADLSDNGTTPNFAWGTDIVTHSTGFTPAGGTAVPLTGNTNILQAAYASGAATSAGNMSYLDVGSITLRAEASNYLNSGADVVGYQAVGRFYPDHFTLTNNAFTEACGSFTYMNQPYASVQYSLEARGINEGITGNYDTAAGYNTPDTAIVAENNNDGLNLGGRLLNITSDWVNGAYTLNASNVSFDRAMTPDGPYSALDVGVSISNEIDSRAIEGPDMNVATTDDCTVSATPCDSKIIDTIDVRYGRFVLQNAFGSELAPLAIPLRVEYYDEANAGFMLNSADSCSDYDGTTMNVLAASGLTPANLVFSGTGTTASGLPDPLNPIRVTQATPGEIGSADIELPVPAWLQYDWDNNGTDDDPAATITFGIYGGSESTIYYREVYQ